MLPAVVVLSWSNVAGDRIPSTKYLEPIRDRAKGHYHDVQSYTAKAFTTCTNASLAAISGSRMVAPSKMGDPGGDIFSPADGFLALNADCTIREGGIIFAPDKSHCSGTLMAAE